MSRSRSVSILILRIAAPLIILSGGFFGFRSLAARRKPPAPVDQSHSLPIVQTRAVEVLQKPTLKMQVDGLVVPHREIVIAAEVAGRIETKFEDCRAGRFVKQHDDLFTIDAEEYRLEVARLKQEKEQAEFSLQENLTEQSNSKSIETLQLRELTLHKNDRERLQKLSPTGATTQSALDAAERAQLTAENALTLTRNRRLLMEKQAATLASAVKLVQEKINAAQLHVDRATVQSPIDGIIVFDHVEQDSFVQRGTALVTIEDSAAVEVRCNLQMEELYWVWQSAGQKSPPSLKQHYELPEHTAKVVYELGGTRFVWDGKLARYEGIGLDEKTRTVPCRVYVKHPRTVTIDGSTTDSLAGAPHPPALVRGMYVTVIIEAKPTVALLRVPEAAIQPGNVVWRVDSEHRLQPCPVRIAQVQDGWATIHGAGVDLADKDHVVVSPISTQTENLEVQEQFQQ